MPHVSIHIVAWNSMRFLPDLFKTLAEQTYTDFQVLVIDNGSTDGVEAFIRAHYPQTIFLRNARNLGFSTAHNQGIRYALEHWPKDSNAHQFILVTNPDILLSSTYVESLMNAVDAFPTVGSFGGKLRRAFGEHVNDETLQEIVRSDLIDSTGLHGHKNCTVTDRGAGQMDRGQFDEAKEVFGISGALALYRASALEDVRFEDEFFDQDFFAYKEDVDLAWRLQQAGWGARFVPEALAFHYRGMYGPEKMSWWQCILHRRKKSLIRNYYSTRNHWLVLVKNIRVLNAILAAPRLLCLEGCRLFYTLVFEPRNARAVFDAMRLIPRMLKKRFAIMKKCKQSAKNMRVWFV